jgi:hypothetical protein
MRIIKGLRSALVVFGVFTASFASAEEKAEEGFKPLFNGKDMSDFSNSRKDSMIEPIDLNRAKGDCTVEQIGFVIRKPSELLANLS